jgi:cell division septum initiation protein DivIVA
MLLRPLPVPPLTSPSLPRAARGYQREATDEFIEELASFYEKVWVERKALHEEVARLEKSLADRDALKKEVDRLRGALEEQARRQQLVTGAIYSAERFAEAIKEEARRDAEVVLKKARKHADEIIGDARKERARFDQEAQRLESLAVQMRSDLMATLASVLDNLEVDISPNGAAGSRSGTPSA